MASCRTKVQNFSLWITVVFLLTWCVGSLHGYEEDEEGVVSISEGRLRGTTMTTRNGRNISAFLGIPYAKPPIGSLRFKNTVPMDPWDGIFDADKDGNQCSQLSGTKVVGYEDCLNLNVFTPQANSSLLLPTMVFIHGGAFLKGNGSTTSESPAYLLDKNIVLVAMNYRLDVLGFLSTGDAAAPGNFGLKDQLMALQWVNRNIKAFGGDPDNVTIFGQSAGSASVIMHALSNNSQGLFKQFIGESGSALSFWAYEDVSTYKLNSIKLGSHLNCSANNSNALVDCLRKTDVRSLLDSYVIFDSVRGIFKKWVPTNEPILDGAFLTTSPINLLRNRKMKNSTWITGVVNNEGLSFTLKLYANPILYDTFALNVDGLIKELLRMILPYTNDLNEFTENIKKFYFDGVEPTNKDAFIAAVTNLVTDAGFLVPEILQMQIVLEYSTKPIYFYNFDYRGTFSQTSTVIGSNRDIGVTHCDDLIYLFPVTPSAFGLPNLRYHLNDEIMIDRMVDLWTSFASTGVPTSDHTLNPKIWKPYNLQTDYLRIGENSDPSLKLGKHLKEKRVHFWINQLLLVSIKSSFPHI